MKQDFELDINILGSRLYRKAVSDYVDAKASAALYFINSILERSAKGSGKLVMIEAPSNIGRSSKPGEPPAQLTGKLRRGIRLGRTGEWEAYNFKKSITMPIEALWLEYGTAPHNISVKRRKYLRFWVDKDGTLVKRFAKEVKHPGIEPRPFILPALMRVAKQKAAKFGNKNAKK